MKPNHKASKTICLAAGTGMMLTLILVLAVFYFITRDDALLLCGVLLIGISFFWFSLLIHFFRKQLEEFTADLCQTLDDMMTGQKSPFGSDDSDTLFARIQHRLFRLYEIMQENQCKVDAEQRNLQVLVSDISHQIKLPLSNLELLTDTLLTKSNWDEEQLDFLLGIKSQGDKLDFLFQALVKTSRLETGLVRLEKKFCRLYDTLAQALSGIVYEAEKKGIDVSVCCPEDLLLPHDSRWTAEALFNLLDNGVKYTPPGGRIQVTATPWEMHCKIDITDTGKGIAEDRQAAVFGRFYREEEVHDIPGVGIGLYLARQIITCQGGYIKISSQIGHGSTFSVFLPRTSSSPVEFSKEQKCASQTFTL